MLLFCHGRAIPRPVSRGFSQHGRTAVRRFTKQQNVLHDKGEARNFNISALRGIDRPKR